MSSVRWCCWGFLTRRERWGDLTSEKKQLPSRFPFHNPPFNKKRRHGVPKHKQEWRSEIKACQKGGDLLRLTQVQMSQCGWISSGILSASSFKKVPCSPLSCHWDKMRWLAHIWGRHYVAVCKQVKVNTSFPPPPFQPTRRKTHLSIWP